MDDDAGWQYFWLLIMIKTNLAPVLEESVDVDHDGEDEDGDGDHGGCVPRELVVRPRI